MAISKMKKVTMILPKSEEDNILKTMQNLQNIEIIDSVKELNTLSELNKFDLVNQDIDLLEKEELTELQENIQKSLGYLSSHTSKNVKFLNEVQTFSDFEKNVDLEIIRNMTMKINELLRKEKNIQDEIESVKSKIEDLSKWKNIKTNLNTINQSEYLNTVLIDFSLSIKQDVFNKIKEMSTLSNVVYENQTRMYIMLVYLNKDEKILYKVIKDYGINVVDYPYNLSPKKQYEQLEKRLDYLNKELKDIIKKVKKKCVMINPLKEAEEVVLSNIARISVRKMLVEFNDVIVIYGWIESDNISYFKTNMMEQMAEGLPIFMMFDDVHEPEDVPTILKNNNVVSPFESLTEMYSLPKYGEVDPTPLLTPFYMVFFGMMVADVGYGLLILLVTMWLSKKRTLRRDVKKFINLFKILSIPVILWGLIYGSMFGVSLPISLLSPTKDMNSILLLSVIFGCVQLLTGLFINGIQLIRKKEYLKSISDAFAWQGVLIGAVLIIVNNNELKNSGLILFISSAVLIIFIPVITNQSKSKGLIEGLYSFYGITGYVGDLVSYTRLMALGIAGGSIAGAFNMLVGFMPPVAKFTVGVVLIIFLHGLNIFLSLLSAYVHGARLQYVEFFGKFFKGGGRKFSPFKPKEKYIDFKTK